MLENLLSWTKAQSGNVIIDKSKFNLHQLVNEIHSIFENLINAKEIVFENNIPYDCSIVSDKEIIATILRNLVSNSVKYTHKRGSIKVDIMDENSMTDIMVTDNGKGIQSCDLDSLFNIGKKLKTEGTNNETGSGLGLIVSKEFADLIGAQLFVESTVNEKTIFTLRIKK